MVSLKSWVRGIFFPPFVIGPAHLSRCNVVVLLFLGPATDEDHKALAVLAKIDAVPGAEINLVFEDALSYALHVGQITPLDPREGYRHLGGGNGVQPFEPLGEAFFAGFVNIAAKLEHLSYGHVFVTTCQSSSASAT